MIYALFKESYQPNSLPIGKLYVFSALVGKRKTVGATTGVRRNCFGERPRRNARVLEVTLPRSPLKMSMTP